MTKRPIEPLLWLLFSAGGVLAALFLPVLVFLFGFAFPLGWLDPPDHDHLRAVLGNPLTVLVLLGFFVLLLVHWAHRFRYTLYDGLQIKAQRADRGALLRRCGCHGRGRGGRAHLTWQKSREEAVAHPQSGYAVIVRSDYFVAPGWTSRLVLWSSRKVQANQTSHWG